MTLISRKIFFDNPDRLAVKLNPNGTKLSFIAPVEGVLNIWVADPNKPENAKPITFDTHRGIRSYSWTYVDDLLLYVQDTNGDENFHIYALNCQTGAIQDLTPFEELHAQILKAHRDKPGEIMVGLNNRRKDLHDVYRLDLKTGELTLTYQNDTYAGFVLDDDFTLAFGVRINSDGSASYDRFIGDKPQPFADVPADDVLTTSALGLRDPDTLYWMDSRGRDTAALYTWHLPSGQMTLLAENAKADIEDVLMHPTTKAFEGAASNYLRKEWIFEKGPIGELITFLNTKISGDLEITCRTTDDHWWIVAALQDQGPVQYYRINTQTREIQHLFSGKKTLENLNLRPMEPVVIQSRDGLSMVSYMTRPATVGPVPFVLMVHGGPNARDSWGYNGLHQWLANRGYGVLSVNYRGSTGFGKNFIMAGNGEWSRKMHDDLIDAVEWLITNGHAPRDKIAIMGGSYGGYATLVGLTFTPDVFACGIDIVGPSNLKTLMETVPPYWKPALDILKRKLGGDLETPQGLKELADRSPLHRHHAIKKPLLIGQGAHDPRVKQAEADQIVDAMVQSHIPITYVVYPDEGHGFARPENRLSFYAITEAFLAQHLGGHLEPIGQDFEGSSLIIEKDTANIIADHQLKGATNA